jgi:hypothetical protein
VNVNIIDRFGISFPANVRRAIQFFSFQVALPNNPDRVEDRFLYQQWCEIEKMLVEREYVDTGITVVE